MCPLATGAKKSLTWIGLIQLKKKSASTKRSSLELSPEQPSKKGKQSVGLTKSDFPNELIDRITDTVKERVHAVIEEVLDRHMAEAVKSIRDAFDGRLLAIEKTVQHLTESLEFRTQHHR